MKNTETKNESSLTNFRGCDCLGAVNKLSGSGNCPNVNGEWVEIEKKKTVISETRRIQYAELTNPSDAFVRARSFAESASG